jgi:hypothetical protein
MLSFGRYIVENNLSNLQQLKRSVEMLVGKLRNFSYSGREMDPAESETYGPILVMHYVLVRHPRKAFRLVLKDHHPVAFQTWTNFGFVNSKMTDPDHTFDLKQQAFHVDELAKTIARALGVSNRLDEGFRTQSPQGRKDWIKLRKQVQSTAGKLTPEEEEKRYGSARRRLGVGNSTFAHWAGRNQKVAPAFEKPAAEPRKLSKHGDVGYISPIARLREKGDTTAAERVEKIDKQTIQVTRTLKNGYGTSALICGRAGTGKTFLVEQELGKENRGKTWETFSGNFTQRSLYLWMFRNRKNKILVLDDVPVFSNEATAQMLKAALNTNPNRPRIIGWLSKTTQSAPKDFNKKADDAGPFAGLFKDTRHPTGPEPKTEVEMPPSGPAGSSNLEEWYAQKEREYEEAITRGEEDKWKPPATFQFDSKIIFITNKPMKDILEHPHLNALATRSVSPVDYDFDDDEMLAKMKARYSSMAAAFKLSPETGKKVYELIEEGHKQRCLTNLSMRTYENVAVTYLSLRTTETEEDTFRELASQMRDGFLS